MNYWESSFCVKISMIFRKSVEIKNMNIFRFIQCFGDSEVLQELYKYNESIISQGELYIIGLLEEEFPKLNDHIGNYDEDIAEWLGYLYGYLMIHKVNENIMKRIDWNRLYNMYDTLHTQSCSYVKNYIMFEKIVKDS